MALPHLQHLSRSGAIALCFGLIGCTATGMDLAAQLEEAAQQERSEASVGPAAEEGSGEVSETVLAGYAGATPSGTSAAQAAVERSLPAGKVAPRSPELDRLIAHYADHHGIPLDLLRRVVNRESTFNPAARNGPYWGLMQIHPQTARTMGYRGKPEGLLDAETNLKYAGKYLRGAYLTANGNHDQAVRFYARGYYYDAKRKGLLEATGLKAPRSSRLERTATVSASASTQ